MYCKHCGSKIDSNSKFCKICGGKLEKDYLCNYSDNHENNYADERGAVVNANNTVFSKNISKKATIAILCIASVFIIAIVLFWAIPSISLRNAIQTDDGAANNPNSTGTYGNNGDNFYGDTTVDEPLVDPANANTIGNSPELIQQGGHFAYQDGWLYYSLDDSGIYKIPDGGGSEDIVKLFDDRGRALNVVGEWLYFRNGEWDNEKIRRVKIDGSEEEVLYSGQIYEDMFVGDDKIFFNRIVDKGTYNAWYISTMNLDGSDMKDIASGYYLITVNFEADAVLGQNKDTYEFAGFNYNGGSTNAYDAVINLGNRYPRSSIITDINGTTQSVIYAYNGGYFFLSHPTETDLDSFTTIGQGSMPDFCYYNGNFYTLIVDSRLGDVDNAGIYSGNDGLQTWIRSERDVDRVYVLGDGWIYYSCNLDYWYRCRLDGTEKESIDWMH